MRGRMSLDHSRGWMTIENSGPSVNMISGLRNRR
jgi:hypothetical protein